MNQSLRLRATRLSALSMMLMLSLVLFQCGKKDDDPTPSSAGVEGTWKMTALRVSPAYNGVTDLFQGPALFLGACFADTKYTFNANGTTSVAAPQGCAVDEDDITDQTGVSDQTKWSVSGNKIVFTTGADKEEYDLKLSGNTMEWSFTETDQTDNKTYTYTIVFTKA